MRTDEQLKQLARDIHEGRVFTSNHIPMPKSGPDAVWTSEVQSVFLPLMLMEQEHLDHLKEQDVRMFYEYYEKAGPRSINGFPSFMSVQTIPGDEMPKLIAYLQALRDAPDPLADL